MENQTEDKQQTNTTFTYTNDRRTKMVSKNDQTETQTNNTELLRRKTGYDQHVSPDSCIMFLD